VELQGVCPHCGGGIALEFPEKDDLQVSTLELADGLASAAASSNPDVQWLLAERAGAVWELDEEYVESIDRKLQDLGVSVDL
jgi:hypothetical protein